MKQAQTVRLDLPVHDHHVYVLLMPTASPEIATRVTRVCTQLYRKDVSMSSFAKKLEGLYKSQVLEKCLNQNRERMSGQIRWILFLLNTKAAGPLRQWSPKQIGGSILLAQSQCKRWIGGGYFLNLKLARPQRGGGG